MISISPAVSKPELSLVSADLHGRRILVVEDEMLIAIMLEAMLTGFGCEAVLEAHLGKAIALAATGAFDAAILDVNLDGEPSYPVARELRRRGIPFVFSTGYDAERLHEDYLSSQILRKPYAMADLHRVMQRSLAQPCPPLP